MSTGRASIEKIPFEIIEVMLKVFVSTMYSGEGDFPACVKSIHEQKDVQVEHHIISHQRELEAHRNQVSTWLTLQHRFDCYVKIDADTILTDKNLFVSVFETMKKHDASSAQIRLHDYYTDSLINGLNFFTKESKFSIPADEIYCDRCVVHKKLIHSDENLFDSNIVPAGLHCWHSNHKQAFHFGVHRGLKNRLNEYNLVKQAYTKHGDGHSSIRAFVITGFEKSKLFVNNKQFNYGDEFFKSVFQNTLKELMK